jgi:hypothetical protein
VYDYYTYHEAREHMEQRMREANAEREARRYVRVRRKMRQRRARVAAAPEVVTARQRTA